MDAPAPHASGLLLGRYRVEGTLGRGGLGVVVKAFDTRLKAYRAIKSLKPTLGSVDPVIVTAMRARFVHEAEAGSRLGSHPHVVTVFDLATDTDTTLYLVLEYLPGGTLAERLTGGPLPLPAALRITREVADGLHAAHRVGIVHRDVKPANLFFTAEGTAKVGDFGVAQIDDLSMRTGSGARHPGTPRYLSPEQERTTGYLPPASDQYSLGLVLFELLHGQAYKRLTASAREAWLGAQPPAVAALVRRMTAGAPEARYPSMAAVVAAIAAIERTLGHLTPRATEGQGGRAMQAVPPGTDAPSMSVTPVVTGPLDRQTPRVNLAPIQPGTAAPRRVTRRAVVLGIGGVLAVGGATGGAWLLTQRATGGGTDGTTGGTVLRTFRGHTDGVNGVAFSPNGQMLASTAGAHDPQARLWRVGDGRLLHLLTGHEARLNGIAFAPDGQLVATASDDDTVRLWRTSDGTMLRAFSGHLASVQHVAYAPDGQRVASASLDGSVASTLTGHAGAVYGVAFAPDGQQVASAAEDRTVRIWRASDGSVLRTLTGHTGTVRDVTFAPDGTRLASASDDGTVRLWNANDGSTLRVLGPSVPDGIGAVAVSPDGTRLVAGGNDWVARVWRMSDGGVVQILGHPDRVLAVAVSPLGTTLATGCADQVMRLWRTA